MSTFILETTEAAWRRAGLDRVDEDGTLAFAERLFADELRGHRLLANRSLWRGFPTVRNGAWHHGNVVLVGHAAHTAHFSIGSATKLALEAADAPPPPLLRHADPPQAPLAHQAEPPPPVHTPQP